MSHVKLWLWKTKDMKREIYIMGPLYIQENNIYSVGKHAAMLLPRNSG